MSALHDNSFALRRSATPYIGGAVILGIVTLFGVFTAWRIGDWGSLSIPLCIWIFGFCPIVLFGTRYRIWWKDGAIVMRTADYHMVTIGCKEITEIKSEVSDVQTLISMRRPFRRIAIYAGHGDTKKFIDVSLKHFKHEDIRKLMDEIHECRPDLSLPQLV